MFETFIPCVQLKLKLQKKVDWGPEKTCRTFKVQSPPSERGADAVNTNEYLISRWGWKYMATKLLLAFALLIQGKLNFFRGLDGLLNIFISAAQEIFTLTFKDSPANDTVLSTLAADTTLHCSATAPSPPFLISWKHNGAYINASSRTYARYNQTTGLSAYTISRGVTYSDSGAYQCVALNAQGNVLALSAIGTLTVVGTFFCKVSAMIVYMYMYTWF